MRPTDAGLRAAIAAHGQRVDRFRRGELSRDEFTPIRLGYGLYYQLDHTSHMQRIKIPGGLLTANQVDCIADLGERYGRDVIHVTTRQDVQIHWVGLEDVVPLYEKLHEVGISTRGACADSVRNVTGCFHAGGLVGELFDVTPYVLAVHEYALFHPLNLTMPRKFKIGFTSCEYDCVQARINDIAFFPKRRDGQLGFSVFAAGGLGSQPFMAIAVRDFIPLDQILPMTEAILRVHHRLGERKNRKRARMKYLVKTLGEQRFVAEIEAELARVEAQCGESLRREQAEIVRSYQDPKPALAGAPLATPSDPDEVHWTRTNVEARSQGGYYGVTVQLPLGDCNAAQLRALADLVRRVGNGTLRTCNDQNLYLPWIPGNRVGEVYALLKSLRLAAPDALLISDVVSCPGADFCSLAVSRSMGMATAIRQHLLASETEIEKLGVLRIRISGCPNSCGQHHVGDIGLTGLTVKVKDGTEVPYYSLLVGGLVGEADAAIGERLGGKYPASVVPRIISALTDHYRRHRLEGERFGTFVRRVGTKPLYEAAQAAGAPE